MIVYLGDNTDKTGFINGLALALSDQNDGNVMNWQSAKTSCESKTTVTSGTSGIITAASSWMLPSKPQWDAMINSETGGYGFAGLYSDLMPSGGWYWSSTEATETGDPALSARAFYFHNGTFNVDDDLRWDTMSDTGNYVRACFAF